MSRPENAPPSPAAWSIEDTAKRAGCGRTTIYAEIGAGRLKARKIGRRTVILDQDLRGWLAALPAR
jgi:excisionase family DNA binding protein